MNTMRLAAALGIVGILSASAGFVACGGDDSSGGTPSPDGSTNDSGDNSDTGSGDFDSGIGDSGPTEAAPPDKGAVQCNGSPCNSDDSSCCIEADGGQSCVANSSTKKCEGLAEVHCDEKADCESGQVCCATVVGAKATSKCAAACPNQDPPGNLQRQICKTSDECDPGVECKPQTCLDGKLAVSTCGGIAQCTPAP